MNFKRIFAAAAWLAACASPAFASTSGMVISQVYGGGGNSGATYKNDFIEIFNAGSAPVNMAGWSVQYASAAGSTWSVTNLPSLVVQPGQYLLVQEAVGAGGTTPLPAPDVAGTIAMSATAGKVALVSSRVALTGPSPSAATLVDLVGFGSANGFEGSAPVPALSNTTAAARASSGCTDTNDNAADFGNGSPAPRSSTTALHPCGAPVNQPIVATCAPFSVAIGTSGSGGVSATDPDSTVNGIAPAGNLPAGISLIDLRPAGGDGGTATAAVSVASTVTAGAYDVSLRFTNDDAQSASCTVRVKVTGSTPIFAIQGSGATSPLVGQSVTTRGVVTKLLNNGFFMQDPVGDGDDRTSDGIFVFTGSAPTVSVGQLVQLSAIVSEFNVGAPSNAQTAAHTVTELTSVSGISMLGSGYGITPRIITLPLSNAEDFERYEGMLVTIDTATTVSQNYFLGRFGQLTLSAGGRMETPTNRFRAGSPEAIALADLNARSSFVLDDSTSVQNPNPIPYIGPGHTVRVGDTVNALTGVIDYGLVTASNAGAGAYKLQPTVAPVFHRDNARTATPAPVSGNVRVASMNVLNYFTTLNDGSHTCPPSNTASDCRGANSTAEFIRQRDKIVAALAGIDADAVGLLEVQNNGNITLQNLVDGLNAKVGAGTYALVPAPADASGTDAIRVAMIYKPARLTRIGSSLADTSPIHNRPPLAQTFAAANGERFSVVINHFKSKSGCAGAGAGDTDIGDGQGCWNARRMQQGEALRAFAATVRARAGDDDVVLLGDFNAYAKEDPIVAFTDAGWTDGIERFLSPGRLGYSFVFDGTSGRLDHALVSASLASKMTGANEWHINADEPSVLDYNLEFKPQDLYTPTPYRSSDHDPVVLDLSLVKRINGTGRGSITGTAGDDRITGGIGAQTIIGGAGSDVFAYTSLRDAGDTIIDFTPGTDRLDLSALLVSIGYGGSNAIRDGVVRLVDTAAGLSVQIDTDGNAGPAVPRALVMLRGVRAADLVASRDLGL